MRALALVGLGGAVGGAVRYLAGVAWTWRGIGLLTPSLLLNAIGSMVVGAACELVLAARSPEDPIKLVFSSGFVGGFTTAAAYTPEVVRLIGEKASDRAIVYAVASIALANIAAIGGARIARSFRLR